MKQPNEEYVFDKEAFVARLLAIRAKPKPKATAQERAQQAFVPTLEVMVKANAQSNRRVLERTQAELEEAERERNRAAYRERVEIANFQAIELAYAQRQAEALAARRYDPTGNWGPPNYRGPREDW
jgi:hypothetical protein